MNQKEIKELIEFLVEKDIAEFEFERGDVKVRVRRHTAEPALPDARYIAVPPAHAPEHSSAAPAPSAIPPQAAAKAAEPAEDEGLHIIRSPIVGTFYESPSPGAPAFAKVGDKVTEGQVLCIIEAMKLMNEIESDYSGEIAKRFVSNGQPVEYGQPLFGVRA